MMKTHEIIFELTLRTKEKMGNKRKKSAKLKFVRQLTFQAWQLSTKNWFCSTVFIRCTLRILFDSVNWHTSIAHTRWTSNTHTHTHTYAFYAVRVCNGTNKSTINVPTNEHDNGNENKPIHRTQHDNTITTNGPNLKRTAKTIESLSLCRRLLGPSHSLTFICECVRVKCVTVGVAATIGFDVSTYRTIKWTQYTKRRLHTCKNQIIKIRRERCVLCVSIFGSLSNVDDLWDHMFRYVYDVHTHSVDLL